MHPPTSSDMKEEKVSSMKQNRVTRATYIRSIEFVDNLATILYGIFWQIISIRYFGALVPYEACLSSRQMGCQHLPFKYCGCGSFTNITVVGKVFPVDSKQQQISTVLLVFSRFRALKNRIDDNVILHLVAHVTNTLEETLGGAYFLQSNQGVLAGSSPQTPHIVINMVLVLFLHVIVYFATLNELDTSQHCEN